MNPIKSFLRWLIRLALTEKRSSSTIFLGWADTNFGGKLARNLGAPVVSTDAMRLAELANHEALPNVHHAQDHASRHEAGMADPLNIWINPSHIGPYSDTSQLIYFRTRDIAGVTPIDHRFAPLDDGYGSLGEAGLRWNIIYAYKTSTKETIYTLEDLIFYLPFAADKHAYMRPLSAGYGYIGTSTYWFSEMHAVSFITHSLSRIEKALEKLKGIKVDDRSTFPPELIVKPTREEVRNVLKTRKAHELLYTGKYGRLEEIPPEEIEPTDAEIESRLKDPAVTGVNMTALLSMLIDSVKELSKKVEELARR